MCAGVHLREDGALCGETSRCNAQVPSGEADRLPWKEAINDRAHASAPTSNALVSNHALMACSCAVNALVGPIAVTMNCR